MHNGPVTLHTVCYFEVTAYKMEYLTKKLYDLIPHIANKYSQKRMYRCNLTFWCTEDEHIGYKTLLKF